MKRKFWNWVRNEGEKRTLILDGEISDETWWGDEVTPQIFRSELNAAEGDIDLWINSPGGDCYAAAHIYNMLMEYKGNVNVKIDGIAASAASVVAMAGSMVEISPLGLMMLHNPMTVSIGDTHEMERTITFLAEIKESIINNSDCKILLDQRKYMNKFDQIQALLGLTEKEKSQILSINMANNPSRLYKEVWIGLGGTQSAVYATEVSAEEYLAYTTEETEKVEVYRLAEQLGGDIEAAIRQLAERRRNKQ
nr:MAG TPA: Putative ATP dependent Clp protease [Caudoviricetes sp.]